MSGRAESLFERLWLGRRSVRRLVRTESPRGLRALSPVEQLEGRRLLAITQVNPLDPSLPATDGDQSGEELVFVADATTGNNTLTVDLREGTDPLGATYIFASVDTGDGSGPLDYYNFSSIRFSGAAGVVDAVVVTTPYEVDLVGFGASGTSSPISSTNWQVDALFDASSILPGDVALFDLFGTDVLEVTAATLSSLSASTIAGQFQPTDSGVSGVPSIHLVDEGTGITSNAAGVSIETFGLELSATNGPVNLGSDIIVQDDLVVEADVGGVVLQDAAGLALITVESTAGDILIKSDAGSITVNSVALSSLGGDITLGSGATLTLDGSTSLEAAGTVKLDGLLGLAITPVVPITAQRLELQTGATSLVELTNVAIGELEATVGGALEVTSSRFVTITDNDPLAASVQITAAEFSLTVPAGIRVIDGMAVNGQFILSTWDASASTAAAPVAPTVPVEFVVTADTDTVGSLFEGELRDMIGYVNRNGINSQAVAQGISTQPMDILFDEPGSPVAVSGVVVVTAALPAISRPITFDGSLSDDTIVGIDGSAIGSAANGLRLASGSSGSTLRDAAFHGFGQGAGIRVESSANVLSGLSVGIDREGAADPNSIGIDLAGSAATRNVIGVETAGVDSGNVIAANTVAGVLIRSGANFTSLYGNQIGEGGAGNGDGIWVQGSLGTVIGGVGLGNKIDSNLGSGIRLTNVRGTLQKYGGQVVGNTISNNDAVGVRIEGGAANVVGGIGIGEGNFFEGNRIAVYMTVDGARQTWGNQVLGNAISGSSEDDVGGVLIERGYANTVRANTVSGLDEWGIKVMSAAVARGQAANQIIQNAVTFSGGAANEGGILVENSSGQIIGGAGMNANVVNQNGGSGIVVIGGTGPNSAGGNLIQGNLVGTDASNAQLGNGFDGIRIQGSLSNVVQANTVRFNALGDESNTAAGISVYDAVSPVAASGNKVYSNTVADNGVGVLVSGGSRTLIGGVTSGAANWIFNNVEDGIRVTESSATGAARATVIQGNRVGMATATLPAGNGAYGIHLMGAVNAVVDSGNVVTNSGSSGIRVVGGNGITIGSPTGKGNTIQANGRTETGNGIEILPPGVSAGRTENVFVAGNTIRSNSGYGILIGGDSAEGTVSGVTVGRSAPGSSATPTANRITQNGLAGVYIDGAQAVRVYGNTIVNNAGLPIEWASPTGFDLLLDSARRTTTSPSSPFEVRGTIVRRDAAITQATRVSIYGTNSATGERFLLGQASVVMRAGIDFAAFRLFVGSAGKQFDRIEASLNVGLSTVASSIPLSV